MDIAGYVYDPQTKKYFRKPPGPLANVKKGLIEVKINQADVSAIISPKPKGIIDLIRHRETGMRKNHSIESPFLNLKTVLNFNSNRDLEALSDANMLKVLMVKGGQVSIFGLWQSMFHYCPNIVGEVLLNSKTSYRRTFVSGFQDCCDGYEDSELLMIAYNDLNTRRGRVVLLPRGDNIQPARCHLSKSAFFSCCCNSFVKNFAIGSEYSVEIENSLGSLFSRSTIGNVHSVHYNDSGNVLFCGIHTGAFSIIDLRQRDTPTNIKLFDTGINESCLLANQQIILGTFAGHLSKFDLRMLKKMKPLRVAEYLNHFHSPQKSPLSVNESFDLLCATGKDNLTRIWSMNGGVPIRVIHPPVVSDVHRAWLLNDTLKATMYLFQNTKVYSCEF